MTSFMSIDGLLSVAGRGRGRPVCGPTVGRGGASANTRLRVAGSRVYGGHSLLIVTDLRRELMSSYSDSMMA